VDIPALKQQARALEQQGSVDDALEVYRQVLADLEAIGGVRQELPLLIKIGDLLAKSDDLDGAVQMYERAAGEYALQGSAQAVVSLCAKILRADPQETGAYLRLARRMLDAGHIEGTRQVLIDYAQRGQLDRTREGLEALAGRPDDEVRRRLDKAIFTAERRLAKRAPPAPRAAPPPARPRPRRPPRAAAPAAPPLPVPEEEPPAPPEVVEPEPEEEPETEPESPGPPKRRLTVPLGALDAEPEPDLLQTGPPELKPESAFPTADEMAQAQEPRPPQESRPQDAFPTAEDLQAPATPPRAAPPPPPPPGEPAPEPPPAVPTPPADLEPPAPPPLVIEHGTPEPLGIDTSLAPMPRGSEPALERPELPPELPSWSPDHSGAHHAAAPPQEPAPPPPPPPPRVSQPEPRISREAPRTTRAPTVSRVSRATRAPRRAPRRSGGWLWPVIVVLLLGGGGGLVWRGILPVDRLRHLLGEQEAAAPTRAPRRAQPRGDTVMARDTAGFARPAPARPGPEPPFAPTLVLPQVPVTLPAGVTLTRPVYVVRGLRLESVVPDSSEGVVGYRLVQVLPSGQRIVLEELPSDTVVAGEIGVTGIDPDTVVGHTGVGGLAVTLKGLITEDMVVQLLQQLVPIGP
jgi:hypothetical protein